MVFVVVEFVATNEVEIIPNSWLCNEEEDLCYWPPTAKKKIEKINITKSVPAQVPADKTWDTFTITVLGKACKFSNYV